MQERVLEFYRRVLPENHPDIGEGRVGIGVACGVLCSEYLTFCLQLIFLQPWLVTTSVPA
jgi:hypothetical protein